MPAQVREVIEQRLKRLLGRTYGGPSLSYDKDNGEWVIYCWGDAPTGMDELGRSYDLQKAIAMAEKVSK